MDLRSSLPRAAAPRDWLHAYPPEIPPSLVYPDGPVSALMETAARNYPERPACTLFNQSLSYAQVAAQARGLAKSLAKLGAGRGRFVGMLLPNIPEYVVALQATWLTGATALQLSPLMVAEEIDHWLAATGCHILVTFDLLAPLARRSLQNGPLEHLIVTSLADRMPWMRSLLYYFERMRRNGLWGLRENGHVHWWEHLAQPAGEYAAAAIEPAEDSAVVVPTGGTTAAPKAVMLTHRNLVCQAFQLRAWGRGTDGAESILGVLPFFHAYGLSVGLLTSMAKAANLHLLPRFDAAAVLDLLERKQIDLMPAVPAMLHALNKRLAGRKRDLSKVRAVLSGASLLDPAVRAEFMKYGSRLVVEGYGLSEAGPVTHVNPLTELNRPGTIGVPLPDTEARIVDAETGEQDVRYGEVGELIVRGPQVMKGYYNNPVDTALALRDGWLFTGDLVRRDADGFFTVVDRKKDIIKTNGFLVFPAEVEEVLCRFVAVAEAAVIGEPDREHGEVIKALVVPRAGCRLNITALNAFCREHLSRHKQPKHIEVVRELPKNFLGKIQRRKLRELVKAAG